ncbi:hypothetical protein L1987_37735 [Smallanthus sonchifolius]|uniref:Uncharacterized protein n=1 Tax=Smallanthus sonchifolius TaxID=185202 RepID=A0ACB9HIG7_9ASTR|nr:hypothetical protein L1987_37735 [Smallanthus sonchifolius]
MIRSTSKLGLELYLVSKSIQLFLLDLPAEFGYRITWFIIPKNEIPSSQYGLGVAVSPLIHEDSINCI